MNTFININGKTYQGIVAEIPDKGYAESEIRERVLDEVLKLLDEEPIHGGSGIRLIELASIGSKIEELRSKSE